VITVPHDPESTTDDLLTHFDARAATYTTGASWVTDPVALAPIVSWFENHSPKSAVEFGVGTGAVPASLSGNRLLPDRYYGIDISPEMLRHATGWTPVNADASHTSVASDSIDVVVARQVFHYFENPMAALDEARRILRHDGTIIVSHIVPFDDGEDENWWTRAVELRQPLRRQMVTHAALCRWLDDAGFGIVDTVEVSRRSSLQSWLRRYPVTAEAKTALSTHYRRMHSTVARIREPRNTPDGDITFNIRWMTVVARPCGPPSR